MAARFTFVHRLIHPPRFLLVSCVRFPVGALSRVHGVVDRRWEKRWESCQIGGRNGVVRIIGDFLECLVVENKSFLLFFVCRVLVGLTVNDQRSVGLSFAFWRKGRCNEVLHNFIVEIVPAV